MTQYRNSNLRQRVELAAYYAMSDIAIGHDRDDAIAEACRRMKLRHEQAHLVEKKLS